MSLKSFNAALNSSTCLETAQVHVCYLMFVDTSAVVLKVITYMEMMDFLSQ